MSIDFWRGFALLTIFINHVPGHVLGHYTYRNFGVSDAAELFVLLAGVSAAFAYQRGFVSGARLRVTAKMWLRAFHLYVAHLALLLVAVAVVGGFVVLTADTRVLGWFHLNVILDMPMEALVGMALMTYQPAYLNILPLYVTILLLAPLLVALMQRSMMLGLGFSLALYLFNQFAGLGPPVWPNSGDWFFNPFAWQLLFACGLAIGRCIDANVNPVKSRMLDVLAPAYLLASMGWALAGFPVALDLSPLPAFIWDFDKTNLALPRILHVLALFYCVSRLPLESLLRRSTAAMPLIVMGRHALPVFCVGTVLSLAAQLLRPMYNGAHDGAGGIAFDLLIAAVGFSLQWLLAWALEWHRSGLKTVARSSAPA